MLYGKNTADINKIIEKLRKEMKKASESLEFERAAQLRDEIKRIQLEQLDAIPAAVGVPMANVSPINESEGSGS
jgi:hypothetical protein